MLCETAADFPDRCVICNGPTGWYRRWTRVAYCAPDVRAALAASALMAPAGTAVALSIAGDPGVHLTIPVPLCLRHRRRPLVGQLVRWTGWLMVLAGFSAAPAFNMILPAMLAMVLGLVTVALGERYARVAPVKRIAGGRIYFRLGRRFVESLPPSPWD